MKKMGKKAVVMILFLSMLLIAGCAKEAQKESETEGVMTEESESELEPEAITEATQVVSLKGPTTLGLLNMMEEASKDEYAFQMLTDPSEAAVLLSQKKADIALLPANLAANLYQKLEGNLVVMNINTMGVLYFVQQGEPIVSIQELVGKTLYTTGKGATPDFALQYVLSQNEIGLDELSIEYKSEAAEVVAALAANQDAIGLLPQPFVTVATMQNEELKVSLDLTKEWEKVDQKSSLVTGVTVVRREYLEAYPERVEAFLKQQKASTEKANTDIEGTAALAEQYEIINAAVAEKAIPFCNIIYFDGLQLQPVLEGYLETLYQLSPESIGGEMPDEAFYME